MRILRMTAPGAPAPDRFVILDRFVLENRDNGTCRDLMERFPNEESAHEWFVEQRWIRTSRFCPHCGNLEPMTVACVGAALSVTNLYNVAASVRSATAALTCLLSLSFTPATMALIVAERAAEQGEYDEPDPTPPSLPSFR